MNRSYVLVLFAVLSLLLYAPASAQHEGHAVPDTETTSYERTVENYEIPDVTLVDQEGRPVKLRELLGMEKPVLVEFVFATCTTICPIMSAGFSNLQRGLGDDVGEVQLLSVTIDPEHDSPEILRAYLNRYRAREGWDFVTGDRDDIDLTMHAFDSYVSDKMLHEPVTLLRAAGGESWIRVKGLLSGEQLMHEYRALSEGAHSHAAHSDN